MALLQQSLRKRLGAYFVSICPETLDGDQSVYKRIVDQLEDLQRFHQELIAESGVSEDPKTFESKQKEYLEGTHNDTLKSINSLLKTFENICLEYRQNIMFTKPCISNHINEIELQTRADSLVITHHVQNAMHECIRTKSNINRIVMNHDRVRRTNGTIVIKVKTNSLKSSYCENDIKNMIEQLERQKQYYADIINELKNRILSIEEENRATFAIFSQIMSNAMNLQMKYDCIQIVCETCSKVNIKVSDYEELCRQTGKILNLKIEDCKSELSTAKEKRNSILSEWNDFQARSNEISDSLSEDTNKYIEMIESLDISIQEKTIQLHGLNNDIGTIKQSTQESNKKKTSGEIIFQELKITLTALEKSKDTCRTRANEKEAYERKLLSLIKDLDENTEKLTNKMIAKFNKVFIENYISNLVVYAFNSVQSVKLQIPNRMFDEMTKKISELEIEQNELRCLTDKRVDILRRERRKNEKSQMIKLSLEVDKKRKLLDLSNQKIDDAKVKILVWKDLCTAAVLVEKIDNCIKVLLIYSRSVMIVNYGKTLVKLIEEEQEVSSSNLSLADDLRYLSHEGRNMEALLEERIQLLQDRMKAITAQREQIEQANRGLEEELNKLSKNFVKITNNVKVTDETEEEKTN